MTRFFLVAHALVTMLAGCGSGPASTSDAGTRSDAGTSSDAARDAQARSDGQVSDSGADAAPAGDASIPAAPAPCPDIGLDPSMGTIHYVCDCGAGAAPGCNAGSDDGDGTEAHPWQTYEKARLTFATLHAGDSIAFCRGGVFEVTTASGRWVNPSCRAAQPCVVRDYTPDGLSGADRPLLVFGDQTAFDLQDGGNADHEEGYTFLNLSLRSTSTMAMGNGFEIFNDIDDVLICNVSIDNFRIGLQAAGANTPNPGSDGLSSRIIVRNSSIVNCNGQGWLGGSDDSGVEYSTLRNNGYGRAVFNHNLYFSQIDSTDASGNAIILPSHNMRAIGNDLYQATFTGGQCTGTSLVVHGQQIGLRIENNYVHEDVGAAGGGCWGITVVTGYEPPNPGEFFQDVAIRNNVVANVGNVAIGLNACSSCVVENNVVVTDQAFGTEAILIDSLSLAGSDDAMLDAVTVRNNSIYFGANAGAIGITLGFQGTNHVLVSNAVYYAGTSTDFDCYALDLPSSAYAAADYNLCFVPGGSSAAWINRMALADWTAASGLDSHSLWADPLFRMPLANPPDLTPSPGSALIGHGDPTRSTSLDQQGRPRGLSPSIGALEPL